MFNRYRLAAPLSLLLIATLALMTSACSGGGEVVDVRATEIATPELRGFLAVPPSEKPNMILTDTSGKPYDIVKETSGKLTLFYLGYSFCPDICPTTMSDLGIALQSLTPKQRENVVVVFVTADPDRDTPPVLRKWLDAFDTTTVGLIPTHQQLDRLTAMLGMATTETTERTSSYYTVSHAAYVTAFDKDDVGTMIYPFGITVADWKHDLPLLIKGVTS